MWSAVGGFWAGQRLLSIAVILLLLGSGAYTYTSLVARDGFPSIALPLVVVTTDHSESTPAEADTAIATPLNAAIGELDDVVEIRTTSTSDAVISTVFTSGDGDSVQVAGEIVEAASGVGLTVVATPSSFDTIGFTVAVSSTELDPAEVDQFAVSLSDRLIESEWVLDASPTSNFDASGRRLSFSRLAERAEGGSFDSQSVTTITLQKPADVDTLTFSDEVNELLNTTLRNDEVVPGHVSFTAIGDQAPATRDQIAGLESSLIQSLLIVAVMVLLLVNWRAAVVAAIFVPTVMAATVLALYLAGATLNTISMFGLLLVLGLFIDDIIVVVEAIVREREQGITGIEAVRNAVRRIGNADVMGSLTTIAVFAPLLFLPGLLGTFVIQLPLAVILALILSVILALSAFLWLATVLVAEAKPNRLDKVLDPISRVGGGVVSAIHRGLERFVGGYLRSKLFTTLAGAAGIVVIVAGLGVAANLDLDIFPTADDSPTVQLSANFSGAASIDDAETIAAEVEERIVAAVGDELEQVVFYDVDLLGASLELVLSSDRTSTAPEIAIAVDESLSAYGPASVSETTDAPPTVAFLASDSAELEAIVTAVPNFLAEEPDVVFGSVAPTSVAVSRWNNSLAAVSEIVLADGADSGAFLDELGASAAADSLGVGITADRVDTSDPILEDQENSFGAMGLVFLVSIFVVALLLVIQFRSILLPGLILMAIPLALPLLFPGLLSVGADLSFFVMLGICALIGIAVNNSIMLIDYANQEVGDGAEPQQAIMQALRIRFRPLVTAALTTVVGIYPLTTDPQFSGLAWTVIFGLISSTLLVVTVFPAYYVMVQTPRSAVSAWRTRRKQRRTTSGLSKLEDNCA